MAGLKKFTAETVEVAEMNDYLASQVVGVFDSAAARSAYFGGGGAFTVVQGMVTYLKDTDEFQVYKSTGWATIGATGSTGATGATGASGATGATGSTGSAGAAATITLGSVTTGIAGSSATITNTGTSSDAVFNFSVPRGSDGAQGTTGATGATGATGVGGGGTIPALPYRSGAFYRTPTTGANTLATYAVNTSYYIPFYVTVAQTFDRIAINASASFVGSGSIRLGIYNNTAGVPSTVLLDAGTVAASAASTQYTITISQALSVGYYWLAFNTVTAAATNSFTATGTAIWNVANLGATSATTNAAAAYSETVDTTGGFATAGTLAAVTGAPVVVVRAA